MKTVSGCGKLMKPKISETPYATCSVMDFSETVCSVWENTARKTQMSEGLSASIMLFLIQPSMNVAFSLAPKVNY